MIDLCDTEATDLIAGTAEKFSRERLGPMVAQREGKHDPAHADRLLAEARDLGFLAAAVPEARGGMGLSPAAESVLVARLARGCAGFAATVAAHSSAVEALARLGDAAEAAEVLRGLGDESPAPPKLLALAFPEEVEECDRPVSFLCLPAPEVEAVHRVVLVDRGEAVRVLSPRAVAGSCAPAYPGSGLEELPRCRLRFDPAEAAASVGEVARTAARAARRKLKLLLAAVQLGNAEAAQAEAVAYAQERRQTGRRIIDHQEVRRILIRSEMHLRALESYLLRTALSFGRPHAGPAAEDLLFRFAAQACEGVCLEAVQTLGGYGYMKDYGTEKRLRDAKSLAALPGTFLSDTIGL